ncbi:helix-turn-helix domain-containing protein [Pseudomonas sp. CFBP 8770]|uniref:RodZ domain-containing protein n=1 Tax=unclassified Pseudomonas TaxID=196821 RepID=UPI001785A7E5|nr:MULTISPECIES: RodZ family helix-turn-helix domain-containing protein [unclassified Pseudomonas]MBD8475863.1 helix-turn-helix domain-containing protein [Pseudomonas sp. CFBP 8773]MBD8648754.1 helix-turn-helix domain-containing protein [Pseudomonas sp. CFBP 8770]
MKAAHPEVAAGSRVNPGDTLRQARESKEWSLPEVAARLNLTPTSLANLEAGAFDKLPGHTFSRGYIRAYAKLLGLDQAVLVQAFDQYTGTNAQGSNVHGLGRIEEPSRLAHNLLRIVSLMLVLALVGGGFLWWQDKTTARGTDPTNVALEHVEVESADGTTQIHPLDEPEDQAVVAAREGEPTALSLTQGQAPVDPATTGTPAATAAQTPAALPQAPAAAAAPSPSTVATTSAADPAAVPAPVEAPVAGQGQVGINFVADCWTQVSDATGKVLYSGLKRSGENLQVGGKPPFAIRLGVANAAQVTYNGQAVDVAPFTKGNTARMKLGQ